MGAGGASCEAPGASLAYDPAGRLAEVASGGAATRFLYDGDDAIAEYDASGAVLRRYVHGPGADEPLVWYEGAGTSDKRWLIADERGSVQAVMRAGASVLAVNRYDPYGRPAAGNQGRFQYTGQMWLPEAGVYHFKARAYHPGLGRFLQTDPIGIAGGMNLYAYAGNDPVNFSDPTGLEPCGGEGCSDLEIWGYHCAQQGDRGFLPETNIRCEDVLAANQTLAAALLDALDVFGPSAYGPMTAPAFYGRSGLRAHTVFSGMDDIDAVEGDARWGRTLDAASRLGVDTSSVSWDNRYALIKEKDIRTFNTLNGARYSQEYRQGYVWLGGVELGGSVTIYRTAVAGQISRVQVGLLGTWEDVHYAGYLTGLFVLGHELRHVGQIINRDRAEWDANDAGRDLVRNCFVGGICF